MSNSSSKSAEIVGSIDDLMALIFLRLPIRSLIRFKSVSKQWFSLITNPKFCHLHSSSRKTNPATGTYFCTNYSKSRYEYVPFSVQKTIKAPSINFDFTENPSISFILHSCNGLLLLYCSSISSSCITFYVYNPTTNSKTVIPESRSGFHCGTTLAFVPMKSPHYKVVCVRLLVDKASYEIHIYSSETDEWRIWSEIEIDIDDVYFSRGVYWNGSIHWISSSVARNSLRFHVGTQELDEMPTPPYKGDLDWDEDCYFGESCDHLNFIQRGCQFNVYEIKRDYSEWFVKYFVDLSPVITAHPEMANFKEEGLYNYFSISSLLHGEKEEDDSILVLLIPGKAIKYNLVEGKFEKLHKLKRNLSYDVKGFQYIESLSCV